MVIMRRIVEASISSHRFALVAACLFAVSLHGCAVLKIIPGKSPAPAPAPHQEVPEGKVERNDFSIAQEDDIIGEPAYLRVAKGDTLPDIARHFSLGINEISAANPGVDTWVPEAEARILLPL